MESQRRESLHEGVFEAWGRRRREIDSRHGRATGSFASTQILWPRTQRGSSRFAKTGAMLVERRRPAGLADVANGCGSCRVETDQYRGYNFHRRFRGSVLRRGVDGVVRFCGSEESAESVRDEPGEIEGAFVMRPDRSVTPRGFSLWPPVPAARFRPTYSR